ncbi:MAG: zinc ABC transporter substrate-binding protein [Gammaproteobacteria bacterium]|jgi:zinc transport system substrate-binding protein
MQSTIMMRTAVSMVLLMAGTLVTAPVIVAAPALTVGVSVLPQKYFVERIAGENANVIVMVGPGHNPATYEPRPRQITQLHNARLYFLMGVPFEARWLKTIASVSPDMKLISLTEGVERLPMAAHESPAGHASNQDHQHGSLLDPHVWLSPVLVKKMAATIKDALIDADAERRQKYQLNYQQFIDDLDKLDQTIRQQLHNVRHRKFLVFHPSWGYYAQEYGLEQIAIERQGKQPGARSLAKIVNQARQQKIKVIFVQQQFSQRDAKTLARQIGASVVQVDPLAENYIDNLYDVTQKFVDALQ